jgi:hypothetical protein
MRIRLLDTTLPDGVHVIDEAVSDQKSAQMTTAIRKCVTFEAKCEAHIL